MERPVILGAGSWGTALALVLSRQGLPVRLWAHNPSLAAALRQVRGNQAYLPGFPIPENVMVSAVMRDVVLESDAVVFAVPSHALRRIASDSRAYLSRDSLLISAAKGIEEDSLQRMSEILSEVCESGNVAALSGPSFAREVAAGQPTALVAASLKMHLAQSVQQLFSSSRFRVYTSQDLCGVELGGAVKNVIAIAAGVCHGLQLGANSVAALITRGLAEMTRLARALGAQPQTLAGLAGLGDLVLTCTGELSRNRQLGIQLAQGKSLGEITAGLKTVAEGLRTTHSVVQLGSRERVSLPISEQMQALLTGRCRAEQAIGILMDRALKEE